MKKQEKVKTNALGEIVKGKDKGSKSIQKEIEDNLMKFVDKRY